jgi:hypothetical protein
MGLSYLTWHMQVAVGATPPGYAVHTCFRPAYIQLLRMSIRNGGSFMKPLSDRCLGHTKFRLQHKL